MYIEFTLPLGATTHVVGNTLILIRRGVVDWAIRHDIAYTEKTIKYTHRIVFDDDAMCNFFVLSYDGPGIFRIVNPLNNLT